MEPRSAKWIRSRQKFSVRKIAKNLDEVLYYQSLSYVLKIICSKFIDRHYNNHLVGYFGVDKIKELIGRKYYWQYLKKDVKAYFKGCNGYLASKVIKNKPYGDQQSMKRLFHRFSDWITRFNQLKG